MVKTPSLRTLPLSLAAAFVLWYLTFNTATLPLWSKLLISSVILTTLAMMSGAEVTLKPNIYEVIAVIWVAILLYFLFWILNFIATFSPLLREEIKSVYEFAANANPFVLGLALVVIALCEEIFWRGYVSESLLKKIDVVPAILLASALYSIVHVFTLNLALILGAFIVGLVMNLLYVMTGKVSSTIYAHAIWSVTVFLLLPLA